jgi:hypothetical protein
LLVTEKQTGCLILGLIALSVVLLILSVILAVIEG